MFAPQEPAWQPTLFGGDDVAVDPSFGGMVCHRLDADSWLDHVPGWLRGSDHVFASLASGLAWGQRRVHMYDKLVDEPRLTWWADDDGQPSPVPLPVLDDARRALEARYAKTFDSLGCNYYRTGRDSVAWHGDRVRHHLEHPVVATISVGSPRPFLLRRRGGGPSLAFHLGHGDLAVMGGACQHRWEHCVPKVKAAGPRISIMFRHLAD